MKEIKINENGLNIITSKKRLFGQTEIKSEQFLSWDQISDVNYEPTMLSIGIKSEQDADILSNVIYVEEDNYKMLEAFKQIADYRKNNKTGSNCFNMCTIDEDANYTNIFKHYKI